jgi:hypothetical protein
MMRRILGLLTGLVLPFALAACPGSDGGSGSTDPGDVADVADVSGTDTGAELPSDVPAGDAADVSGTPDVLAGSFLVSLEEAIAATSTSPASDAYSKISGTVADGPSPALILWNPTMQEGDCRLLTPQFPFCSVSCGGAAACVADEVCLAYPNLYDIGIVTVTGVHPSEGVPDVTMEPASGAYQTLDPLPFPPFQENEEIVLEAAGGDIPGFTITSRGIAPLVMSGDTPALARDQALDLEWTAPGIAGASTIHVKLDISHHGGFRGKIECDVVDTGSLSIPASLINPLLDLGVAGFPSVVVTRHAVGSTTIAAGRVELEVLSSLDVPVSVPGVVSCNETADCPQDQTCQDDLTCQ